MAFDQLYFLACILFISSLIKNKMVFHGCRKMGNTHHIFLYFNVKIFEQWRIKSLVGIQRFLREKRPLDVIDHVWCEYTTNRSDAPSNESDKNRKTELRLKGKCTFTLLRSRSSLKHLFCRGTGCFSKTPWTLELYRWPTENYICSNSWRPSCMQYFMQYFGLKDNIFIFSLNEIFGQNFVFFRIHQEQKFIFIHIC
jgi:hypothetical protein